MKQLKYIGRDDWDRKEYEDQNGRRYAEVDGVIHTLTDWDEPLSPLRGEFKILGQPDNKDFLSAVEEQTEEENRFNYMMLGRMQSDCKYWIHCSEKGWSPESIAKHMSKESPEAHIKEMKRLYELVPQKPEWLTMEEIEEFEEKMLKGA